MSQTFKISEDVIYKGEVQNGKPNGYGALQVHGIIHYEG